jgi:hypothetical protein
MNDKVRRSWLLVPLAKEEGLLSAGRSDADVVVLELAAVCAARDVEKQAALARLAGKQ